MAATAVIYRTSYLHTTMKLNIFSVLEVEGNVNITEHEKHETMVCSLVHFNL
jgi:hypothetical protein